eukprot:CAMPEP_0184997830 /NCGR_PEP_ID=MMETSP1098-20130426/60665_1 /TAXON_ID=89044 /ORGANISM="Spumella elongata, Strain CCAP 955/1" /LENGTH=42 /DNA_ID= /DNA_START= /DNA_END= /DNA_ORIENTATION=
MCRTSSSSSFPYGASTISRTATTCSCCRVTGLTAEHRAEPAT